MRKDKVVKGMIENLRQGYWVAATPFGYTNLNKKEKAKSHKYEINKDGELLNEGFKLKAERSLTNQEIVNRLKKKGCKINYKSFVRIIGNPFYCGYITHSLIPGEIHRGKHPALVSEKLFIAANELTATAPSAGIAKKFKIEDLPLKIFAKAETSPTLPLTVGSGENAKAAAPLTGYRKKGIYYYKSRGKGPAINVNAAHLNNLFSDQLRKFEYDKKHTKKLQKKSP